jgi:hypothetical protein
VGGDDAIGIFGINRTGVSREVYKTSKIKINKHFNIVTNLESLELEVSTFCLVTGCGC